MTLFRYEQSLIEVAEDVAASHRSVWEQLRYAGTWWTAAEMLSIAARTRAVFAVRHLPPWSRDLPTSVPGLSDAAVTAVDHIVSNPGSTDREWALSMVSELGDGEYVELVGVVATVVMVDMFANAAGVELTALPSPATSPGAPTRERPDGLGDVGAHVQMLEPFPYANVARALSLVPSANTMFRTTSVPMYSAPGMSDLVWDTPLQRPQVELVASRVAALNEFIY